MNTLSPNYIRNNTFVEKLFRNKVFWALFVIIAFAYPIYRSVNRTLPPELPIYFQLPNYKFTNELGKPFGSNDLKGRTYIASFMFTSCPSSCPALMEKMQKVQKRVRGLGQKVALVTYTVDPENDTTDVLYKYSRNLKASPHIWTFLTSDKGSLRSLIVDGFKVPMGDMEETNAVVNNQEITMFDIVHSEKFVLVDGNGQVRGYYSTDDDSINKLMIDVGLMINRAYN